MLSHYQETQNTQRASGNDRDACGSHHPVTTFPDENILQMEIILYCKRSKNIYKNPPFLYSFTYDCTFLPSFCCTIITGSSLSCQLMADEKKAESGKKRWHLMRFFNTPQLWQTRTG